jgi:osmotically-inducible protein OsmY
MERAFSSAIERPRSLAYALPPTQRDFGAAATPGHRLEDHMKLLSVALITVLACCACKGSDRSRDDDATRSSTATSQMNANLAKEVRQAISNETGLSYDARNVSVLADNGTVTLRGIVSNDEEKKRIEEIAQRCPGVQRVDNELTVRA